MAKYIEKNYAARAAEGGMSMSGIYIKCMEMPTRCGRCDMCVKEVDGDIDYHYECCITAARIDNLGEKMEDCPLVPVPPHGRLIDADALMLKIQEYIEEYDDLDENGYHNLKWCAMKETEMAINDAPTVIEAEEQSGNSGELED